MSPDDLVLRAERLRARVQRDRSGPRAQRDPTGTEPLELGEAEEALTPPRMAQEPPREPVRTDHPTEAPAGPETEVEPEERASMTDSDGVRWALRCYCPMHPTAGHDARPLR